jgi:hypothetical protein
MFHLVTGGYAARGEFASWFDAFALTAEEKTELWRAHGDDLEAEGRERGWRKKPRAWRPWQRKEER